MFGFLRWDSQEKILFLAKKPEISLKAGFLDSAKKLFHWCAIFGFAWCTVVAFMILQKVHVLEKPFSQVINENPLG